MNRIIIGVLKIGVINDFFHFVAPLIKNFICVKVPFSQIIKSNFHSIFCKSMCNLIRL